MNGIERMEEDEQKRKNEIESIEDVEWNRMVYKIIDGRGWRKEDELRRINRRKWMVEDEIKEKKDEEKRKDEREWTEEDEVEENGWKRMNGIEWRKRRHGREFFEEDSIEEIRCNGMEWT
jgi:hypothetical protein